MQRKTLDELIIEGSRYLTSLSPALPCIGGTTVTTSSADTEDCTVIKSPMEKEEKKGKKEEPDEDMGWIERTSSKTGTTYEQRLAAQQWQQQLRQNGRARRCSYFNLCVKSVAATTTTASAISVASTISDHSVSAEINSEGGEFALYCRVAR
ncbi:26S proteasome non-ATPase regulatory subunit [Dirofilaria immitis]